MRLFIHLVTVAVLIFSCEAKKKQSSIRTSLGKVDQQLEEASGLTASVSNPGMLWAINDSGNPPEVFLIDQHAKTRMVFTLLHAHNRDWEDIPIGTGRTCIFRIGLRRGIRQEWKLVQRSQR